MFRKPVAWITLIVVSAAALFFAIRYFPEAFPIVSIDLRMDRDDALARAGEVAERNEIGPEGYSQAASFESDSGVQTYVELEAGGKEAFRELIESGLYAPYQWKVRHFREGERHEASFSFTPDGSPYGFSESLPEDAPGPSLPSEEARRIAEEGSRNWNVDLEQYELVEWPAETRPGGRTDHTFVYRRPGVRLGEAEVRLSLTVSGERFTGVHHFVRIPEAFSRKYQEMRSSNDTIAFGATVAMGILYILGGCVFGLFYLLRRRYVIWRPALKWGILIGGLQFLAGVNELPLLWMGYDTALSTTSFLIRQATIAAGGALAMAGVLTVTFMAAEGLTRRAFPGKFQFWRLWSPGVVNSKPVLGRTAAGYLLVAVFFAYEVALYIFGNRFLGWWSPSDALIHPDTLATYFPWLNSIAISLQAGFWEECLFRAIPLAGAALLGRRWGKPRLWIGTALLVQAVIFGAAHANYPAQPAYARLVELIIPAVGFGVIYLLFGLLPAIVLHFTFDVVWFALPIFVSTAAEVWVDQALVVILTLVPLWIVLYFRIRRGRWEEPGEAERNASWSPPPQMEEAREPESLSPSEAVRPPAWLVYSLGAAGLAAWALVSNFSSEVPAMTVFRAEAERIADTELERRGYTVSPEWTRLSTIDVPLNENDRFVWQEGGREAYRSLMGSYLTPPYWRVRYVRFEGEVAERAEEFQVHVDPEGNPFRIIHQLPEAREGAQLAEEEARALAEEALRSRFELDPARLRPVAREPSQQPNRRDWSFTFSDDAAYPLEEGEARINVRISGSEVTDAYRYVFVPEEWQRARRSERALLDLIELITGALIAVLVFVGAILALVNWTHRHFSPRSFGLLAGVLILISAAERLNGLPNLFAGFSTSQPYYQQLLILTVALVLGALFLSSGLALPYGLARYWQREETRFPGASGAGIAAGLLLAGTASLASALLPDSAPPWGNPGPASDFLPALSVTLGSLSGLITRVVIALFLVTFLNRLSSYGRRRRGAAAFLVVVFGFSVAGSRGMESLGSWLVSGVILSALFAAVYWGAFRFDSGAVLPALLILTLTGVAAQGLQSPFAGALPATLLAAVSAIVITRLWQKRIEGGPQKLWKRL